MFSAPFVSSGFFPTNSFRYTLGYLAIPLIMHVKETVISKVQDTEKMAKDNRITALLAEIEAGRVGTVIVKDMSRCNYCNRQ